MLLEHTVALCAAGLALAAVIGTGAAWLTERTALRGRRVWTVLLVLPLAIPDFVVGYAWHSIAPRIAPLLGATIVMTLGTYPLVYLPVAAALRRADPGARGDRPRASGRPAGRRFARVTLPLVGPAVLGGAMLVALTVISEYGAFEILRYQTFTTEIFSEFQFDAAAAGALSIPLVALGLLVLFAEQLVPRRSVAGARRARSPSPVALGRRDGPACRGARRAGRPRRGRADRHDRLLDDVQPAHHAPRHRDRRRGAGPTVRYSALGRAGRRRARDPGGDADVPATQRRSRRALERSTVRDQGAARRRRSRSAWCSSPPGTPSGSTRPARCW